MEYGIGDSAKAKPAGFKSQLNLNPNPVLWMLTTKLFNKISEIIVNTANIKN